MNKEEYLDKIKYFLELHHFHLQEDSPITKSEKLVWEVKTIDACYVVKITTDEKEIDAAKKLKGFKTRHLAYIKLVKDVIDFHIIVVEKLEPLTKPLVNSYKKFMRAYRRWIYFYYIVKFITFGKVKITLEKSIWMFSENTLVWLDQARAIKEQANQLGVENPSDFMSNDNIGIKMGTVSSFDVRDEVDEFFYEKL